MKRLMLVCLMLMVLLCMTACSGIIARVTATKTPRQRFWGSYTGEKTYSYDHKYYTIQSVEDRMIKVSIFLVSSGELIDAFTPARSMDFWGICWERDTYNIWTQSGDIGIYCYVCRDGKWERNEGTKAPSYIISRWDENYRNDPELWDAIYMSPTDHGGGIPVDEDG